MLLVFLSSIAFAAAPSVTDAEIRALDVCPEDPAVPCPAAEALFDRVVVEGAALPDAYTPVVAVLRLQETGVARIAGAPDRAAADVEMAAVLETVDVYTGPTALPLEQGLFTRLGDAALEAYAALPGAVGPLVADELARPRHHPDDVVAAIDAACRAEVRQLDAYFAQELAMLSEDIGWTPDELLEGRPPVLVDLRVLHRIGEERCDVLTDQLMGAPAEPAPSLASRGISPGTAAVFERLGGGVWPAGLEVELAFERFDEILAFEGRRAALRR